MRAGSASSCPDWTLAVLGALLLAAPAARAQRVGYTDEDAFLAAVTAAGYVAITEGFEDDAAWGGARTTVVGGPQTAPAVERLGVVWTANHSEGEVTTGAGPARSGSWGFFTLPHGRFATGPGCDVPGACGDGWVGASTGVLRAVGGWVETNTYGAKLGLFLEGDLQSPVDFGERCDPTGEICTDLALLDYAPRFFGVVDPEGFAFFEFRELEGTAEDAKLIFADDFTWAFLPTPCSDGVDNDGDGDADWDGAGAGSPDLECVGRPMGAREGAACGLGPGLALLLPALCWGRRRSHTPRSGTPTGEVP